MIAVGTAFLGKKRRESEISRARGGKVSQIPIENLQDIVRIYVCQSMKKKSETVGQYAKRKGYTYHSVKGYYDSVKGHFTGNPKKPTINKTTAEKK